MFTLKKNLIFSAMNPAVLDQANNDDIIEDVSNIELELPDSVNRSSTERHDEIRNASDISTQVEEMEANGSTSFESYGIIMRLSLRIFLM